MSPRHLMGTVLKAVGAAALLSVVCGGLLGLALVKRGFSARDEPSVLEALTARAARRWSVPSRVKELKSPVVASAEALTEAKAHWADHCAGCHANDGSGATTLGRNLYPKPPDMRSSATQELTDGELYYVIQNGVRLTGMPAWGEPVEDDRDTWALVVFIRALPKLTREEIHEMEKLSPKSRHEENEEQEEDQFLNGPDTHDRSNK